VPAGFGAQLQAAARRDIWPSVRLRVLESTAIAASRREVPVAKVTVVGQVGPFLSPCRV